MKTKYYIIAVVLLLLIVLMFLLSKSHRKDTVNIWCVTMLPSSDSIELQSRLENSLRNLSGKKRIIFEAKNPLGDTNALNVILSDANCGKADLLIVLESCVAREAYNTVRNIPVVYGMVPYPKECGLLAERLNAAPFVGVGEQAPGEQYCSELARLDKKWNEIGIVLPKGCVDADAEAKAISSVFSEKFGSRMQTLTIDAKTCAQLMDVVSAYNLILSKKMELYYVINDGAISKYLQVFMKPCLSRGIPVIGGGRQTIDQGGLLAIVPDTESRIDQCSRLICRVLSGQACSNEMISKYDVLWNTNTLAELGFSK